LLKPTSEPAATAPIGAPATKVDMTPEHLHQAARDCRVIAAELQKEALLMARANDGAAAVNRSNLALQATAACGGVSTSIDKTARYYLTLAEEMDLAAGVQRGSDVQGEVQYAQVKITGAGE
jgi:hypothetical protein